MTIIKYVIYTILILIFGFVFVFTFFRESETWIENITVAKNVILPVENTRSQKKTLNGYPLFGDLYRKNQIKFNYNNIKYIHKVPFIPIVIRMYKNDFYLVYYDRTDMKNITYRFYKSTSEGDFEKIEPTKFPKHLAIQNRWFNGDDNAENLIGLKPEKLLGTTTAFLWRMIEDYPKGFDSSLDFIKQYKEKYITNREE